MTNSAYNFKLMRINLTDGSMKVEEIDKKLAKDYIGGRGLATKILYDENIAKVEPLSPDNKIIFMTGPITGTASPTSGRYMVVTKSPLNNYIDAANSGGVWGARLKTAGWDGIIFEGKSDSPVYAYVKDEKITLHEANELWGKDVTEVDEILKSKYEDASVLSIGSAGEELSVMAAVMNDVHRAAGRGGVGAVMGSKNLKAIVVETSVKLKEVDNEEELKVANANAIKTIRSNSVTKEGLPAYGTAVLVNLINNVGGLPTNNWQQSYFEKADEISGETLAEKYLTKNYYCFRCPIGCGRMVKIDGEEKGGPEYEPLWAYGSNCGISDLDAINKANEMCNNYGLDAISTPCTIATAMELYEKGKITDEDCDGVALKFGSTEAILKWTERIAKAEGKLGALMAKGSTALCEEYDSENASMTVKKMEMPAYDARAIQGIGLNYATSNRGACHCKGYTISSEILGLPTQTDRTKTEGKAELVKAFQDLTAIIDSMGMCLFTSFALGAENYLEIINAATGFNYSLEELMLVGERIYSIERMFNKEAGMTSAEDTLPQRILKEPISNGPSKGMVSLLPEMLPKYYELRGWVDGFPAEETIERLGI